MSADGSIMLVWGDGPNKFRFAIGQFAELQECINRRRLEIGAAPIGPMSLLNLLRANDAWPADVRDVMRIGLAGGGMKAIDVHKKMTRYFDGAPPLEHMIPAFTVLMAGLAGSPEDDVSSKKKTAAMTTSTPQSSSQSSTGPALQ